MYRQLMLSWCIERNCGEPSSGSRCPTHTSHAATRKTREYREARGLSNTVLGYGSAWQRLSKRARSLQDWCSDCFTSDDLTADHSPMAWVRHEQGLAIRLQDISVLCRSCNSRRGKARPDPQGANPNRQGELRPRFRHANSFPTSEIGRNRPRMPAEPR